MEFITLIICITFVATFALSVWMKLRMRASKAKFALTVTSSLVTCLVLGLAAMSSDLPTALASAISASVGLQPLNSSLPSYAVVPITIFAMILIYRFGSRAMKEWEAPQHLSETNLEEEFLENNMFALSFEQISLILNRQSDPITSDVVRDWKERLPKPPATLEKKDLLRELLTNVIREVQLPSDGWRDEGSMWTGTLSKLHGEEPLTVVAFVFNTPPDKADIEQRIAEALLYRKDPKQISIFALYISSEEEKDHILKQTISGFSVTILSSYKMIIIGLDLSHYAREIIRTFESTRIGDTNVTLKTSYVDPNIIVEKGEQPTSLLNQLSIWEKEDTNAHVVLTGEYGQGKSTSLLKFCYDWAQNFIKTGEVLGRVPLLIELRGRNPSEQDPLSFLSSWCVRYRLIPQSVLNLVRSGNAIVIFEGFDELRNSGRAYYRHQHFNALWKFAYPGTKIIFTGRPNFFLDQEEANRTLRSQETRAAVGDAFTKVWQLARLSAEQISEACRSYDESISTGITDSVKDNKAFFDIVSRPSMIPVVATIWNEIELLRISGKALTSAILIEKYVQSVFSRKEAELERDRVVFDAPTGARYLILPRQLRELLTICVAWRMSGLGAKNTIPRSEVVDMVRDVYDTVMATAKSAESSPEVTEAIVEFENRYIEENQVERVEAIAGEICSAGLLVPDPAGGATNLSFPHKQFFEFLVAKAITIQTAGICGGASNILKKSSLPIGVFSRLYREKNTISYLAEIFGSNLSVFLNSKNFFLSKIGFLMIGSTMMVNSKITRLFSFRNKGKYIFGNSDFQESHGEFLDIFAREIQIMFRSARSFTFFMLSVVLFATTTLVFELIFESDKDQSLEYVPAIFGGVMSIICFLVLFRQLVDIGKIDVIMEFVVCNWKLNHREVGNVDDVLRLTVRSISRGEVLCPYGSSIEKNDYSEFLYPGPYFGSGE